MKIQQLHFEFDKWAKTFTSDGFDKERAQLVLCFGETSRFKESDVYQQLHLTFPGAEIVLASTSGEIVQDNVADNSIVATAIQFEKTEVRCRETNIRAHKNSYDAGKFLMQELEGETLTSVFIISDGTHTNGSDLVTGINQNNRRQIQITGGLAGDGARFVQTVSGLNRNPEEGMIVAVGFYGDNLKVSHGSFGGWDEFGPTRKVTKSVKNVLYEIDGKNALELYKEYLGPYRDELPGSALLFPLSITEPSSQLSLVRTILNINEEDKSMTFAGNMPEGSKVRLMKANFDKLIEAASTAATNTYTEQSPSPDLAILISCIGRKLVLQDRTDEEVQAAKEIFGNETCITGFYSYGEISPFNQNTRCELHNQTMTITTFKEQ